MLSYPKSMFDFKLMRLAIRCTELEELEEKSFNDFFASFLCVMSWKDVMLSNLSLKVVQIALKASVNVKDTLSLV